MSEFDTTPRYDPDTGLGTFLGDLRCHVFSSQVEAARFFGLTSPTVHRYEAGKITSPRIGYMASLAMLLVDRWQREGSPVRNRRHALLQEVNKAVKDCYYPKEMPFGTWDGLCQIAAAYMVERQVRDSDDDPIKNPYITGQPAETREIFFGRRAVFDYISDRLDTRFQDAAIVLFGQPRMGKSSVLKQMQFRAKRSHLCVYLNLKRMPLTCFGSFLWQVADETWRALRTEGIDTEQPHLDDFIRDSDPAHSFSGFLSQVWEALRGRRLLLMFDELKNIWEEVRAGRLEGGFFVCLSDVLRHQPALNYIFCTESTPREVSRELAQAFPVPQYIEIGFLELDDVAELANKPVAGLYKCSRRASEKIHEITSGHPYFVQVICRRLFKRRQELQKGLLDEHDVEAVLDEAAELSRSFLAETWAGLAADEKTVVRVLAELITEQRKPTKQAIEATLAAYPNAPAPGQITVALESLEATRIIRQYEPYRFRVDLFRAWVYGQKKVTWIQQEIDHRDRVAKRRVDERPEEVRRLYLRHVRESCRWLDFRGLVGTAELFDVRLADLYVPLHITVARSEELFPMLALRARARFLAEEAAASGGAQISLGLQRELADAMRLLAATVDRPRVDAVEAAKQNPRMVILGDPGSGKSTFLRYLALVRAEGNEVVNKRPGFDEELLPILLPIDAYARALEHEKELSLTGYLPRYFAHRELDLPELNVYFRQELESGHCLVLLDGLDTVLDREQRVRVARQVEVFISRYAEPGNRFVITSRIVGYKEAPLTGNYLHCTTSELEMQEIERFARQWSLACELRFGDTKERRNWADVQASRLIEAIRLSPSVRRLAGNPLLLTMIALMQRQGRLPQRRFALYEECAQTLVERWNQHRALSNLPVGVPMDADEAFRNFGPLALWMHETQKHGTVSGGELEARLRKEMVERGHTQEDANKAARAFLELERNQLGLLVERGQNAYGFSHLTLQEYFSALAVASELSSGGTLADVAKRLRAHLHDPRWREVILLSLAQVGKLAYAGSTSLVLSIADSQSPMENILHRDLILAARSLADDVAVNPQVRRRLLDQLLELWQTASFDRLRREVTTILAAMHGTASEPQVVEALIAGLAGDEAEVRSSAADALGRMGKISGTVLDRLSATLKDDRRPKVRAHAALALGRLNVAPERITAVLNDRLRQDSDREVRLRAAEALAYIGQENQEALDLLIQALKDKRDGNVRGSAAAALASLRQPPASLIDALLDALRDSRVDVRTNATSILGRLGQQRGEVIEALLLVLRDPRVEARISAAMALGDVGDTSKRVVEALIENLGDDSHVVRSNAAAALGKLAAKDDNVVKALERALENRRTAVGAALSLGRAGRADPEIAKVTEVPLESGTWRDRVQAVEALSSHDKGGKASEIVVGTLAEVLTEEHHMDADLQTGMAMTLSEVAKRGESSLRIVLEQLQHPSWVVRAAAVEALGMADVSDPQVIDALTNRLMRDAEGEPVEPSDHVRGNAAAALGALGCAEDREVHLLVQAVDDHHGYVRLAAADALSKLDVRGKSEVLDALIRRLDDDFYSPYHDRHVEDAAFDALWVLAPYSAAEPSE